MLALFMEHFATVAISLVMVGLVALAVRQMARDRKKGGCAGCPSAKGCAHCNHSTNSH